MDVFRESDVRVCGEARSDLSRRGGRGVHDGRVAVRRLRLVVAAVAALLAIASCAAPRPTDATAPAQESPVAATSPPRWAAPPASAAAAAPSASTAPAESTPPPVSSVRLGNQTALNTARVPFATYLVALHNRIHPLFADGFLASLSSLPAGHPLSEPKLHTVIEIAIEGADGSIAKAVILRPSGVTDFDKAALDSVMRAAPFGPAPAATRSSDGRVYVHWEFHRDPAVSCSTINARPFLLTLSKMP